MSIEIGRRSFLIGLGALFVAPAVSPLAGIDLLPTCIRLDAALGARRLFSLEIGQFTEPAVPDFGRAITVRRPQGDVPILQWAMNQRAVFSWRVFDRMDMIHILPNAPILVEVEPLRGGVEIILVSETESHGPISESFTWSEDRLTVHKPQWMYT